MADHDDDDEFEVADDEWCIVRWCRFVEDIDGRPAGVEVSEPQTFTAPEVLRRIRRQTTKRPRGTDD